MTEDMLWEQQNVLAKLGTSREAAQVRAKMQSLSLLSDMQAFKVITGDVMVERSVFLSLVFPIRLQTLAVFWRTLYDGTLHETGLRKKWRRRRCVKSQRPKMSQLTSHLEEEEEEGLTPLMGGTQVGRKGKKRNWRKWWPVQMKVGEEVNRFTNIKGYDSIMIE